MRKGLLIMAAVAAFSCSVEQVDVTYEPEDGLTVLTAGFDTDEDTRTVRQSNGKVFWSPADEISVVRGVDIPGNKFVSDNTEPAAKASFIGRMPEGSGEFWALHPYDKDALFNGDYLMTTVPGEQTAVPGTFGENALLSVSYSSSQNLTFVHVCGGFRFTFSEPGIREVLVTSLYEYDMLSGKVGIRLDKGTPRIKYADGWSHKVDLVAPEGETFTPGVPYYLVTIPTILYDGFSLTFVKENGDKAVRNIEKMARIREGHFLSLDSPDKGLEWERYFSFSPSAVTVPPEGGVFTVDVQSTYPLEIHIDGDWIHEVGREGNLVTGATYTFRTDRNPGEAREGMLSLCAGGKCYPVDVSQGDGSLLKDITHHSLGMRFTATWCVNCPKMNKSFQLAWEALGDKFEYVSLYSSSSGGNYGFPDLSPLSKQYRVSGYPTGIIDGRSEVKNTYSSEVAAQVIASAVEETEMRYPAVSAVALESSLSGRELTVKADVYTQAVDSYKLTVILMENGIIGYQADKGGQSHEDYHHDRVARLALTASTGDEFEATTVGETRTFTYTATVPDECNLDNLVLLAWVQRPFGDRPVVQTASYGDWYVDNCRTAPVGTYAGLEIK